MDKKFKSSEEMCKDMLNKAGVAALPGSDFGFSEKTMYARMSFTDFNGENKYIQNRTILASNAKINKEMIEVLK